MSDLQPHRPGAVSNLVWPVFLSRPPLTREAGLLACTCVAAAAALRRLVSLLQANLSGGAEPRGPVPVVLGPPGLAPSPHPPLPLDFEYITSASATPEPHAAAPGGGARDARLPVNSTGGGGGGVDNDRGSGARGGSSSSSGCGRGCSCCTDGGAPYTAAQDSGTAGVGGSGTSAAAASSRGDWHPAADADAATGGCPATSPSCLAPGVVVASAEDQRNDAVPGKECSCGVLVPAGRRAYDPCAGTLLPSVDEGDVALAGLREFAAYLLECGPACACDCAHRQSAPSLGWELGGAHPPPCRPRPHPRPCACPWRLTQGGLAVPAVLRQIPGKGWGAVSVAALPAGRFVCCYEGEYVTTHEARSRLQMYDSLGRGHALLAVREVLPSGLVLRLNIDATRRGNIARFLNHSCDGGNLTPLVARRRGAWLPAVALFTSRPVAAGEELTYAYGPPNAGPTGSPSDVAAPTDRSLRLQPRCSCGTAACLGYMPCDEV